MLGSLVCALAPNSPVFILGRAIAGFGAGGQFAGGLTIIAYSVPLHRRPTFVGGLTSLYGVLSRKPWLLIYRSQALSVLFWVEC